MESNNQNNNLNLARKWRPSNFNELVGQDIPVKMLLNSLYLEKLFPVYLFAGQRGCGKTSTARIFGAAINCKNVENFKTNPKENIIPCGKCNSCTAMLSGNHPDFIEIDAASHTGVENVRQILENCAYMPILGRKKIYLIDEAHMLSKAAFNALLKILEEPPVSALFILATTEIQKFPATVLSRCFQIIFKSINNLDLKKHLLNICNQENIDIEEAALDIVIQETQGSVRDAINMLERVRFSDKKITLDLLLKQLGKISESEIINLWQAIADQDKKQLFNILSFNTFENINPEILWDSLIQVLQTLLWLKYDASQLPAYFNDIDNLKVISSKISLPKLNAIFKLFWEQEDIFRKTSNKKIFIETLIINLTDLKSSSNSQTTQPTPAPTNTFYKEQVKQEIKQQEQPKQISTNSNWQNFVTQINTINNPFLTSVINSAEFIEFNDSTKTIKLGLENNNMFTQSTINDTKDVWQEMLIQAFPGAKGFDFIAKQSTPTINTPKEVSHNNAPNKDFPATNNTKEATNQNINLSNKENWPTANLIQSVFPGKIKLDNNINNK